MEMATTMVTTMMSITPKLLMSHRLVIFFIFFAATGSPPFRCFDQRNYFSAALSAVSGQTHL